MTGDAYARSRLRHLAAKRRISSPGPVINKMAAAAIRRFRRRRLHRNRKLEISRALTKAKSREPACSQVLNQNKIDRQQSKSRESGRQTVRQLWWMVFGVETGREVWGRG